MAERQDTVHDEHDVAALRMALLEKEIIGERNFRNKVKLILGNRKTPNVILNRIEKLAETERKIPGYFKEYSAFSLTISSIFIWLAMRHMLRRFDVAYYSQNIVNRKLTNDDERSAIKCREILSCTAGSGYGKWALFNNAMLYRVLTLITLQPMVYLFQEFLLPSLRTYLDT